MREAIARLPEPLRGEARLVFTAHSIPTPMAERSRYREQLETSSRLVASEAGVRDWALVYQSRSGRPGDPWLEPDVCDYLRQARADGLRAAVLCPIGFVCDHIEVLYDLDREAADVCRGDRAADDARRGGQRRSAVSRHDGGRRDDDDSPLRAGKAAAAVIVTVRLKPDTTVTG